MDWGFPLNLHDSRLLRLLLLSLMLLTAGMIVAGDRRPVFRAFR